MIRNLVHAAIGVAMILIVGWVINQPTFAGTVHHKSARIAVGCVLAALVLFVLVCLGRAFKGGGKKKKTSQASPYATTRK